MPLSYLNPEAYDAVILPGGFGVAKNLSDFAFGSSHLIGDTDLKKNIRRTHVDCPVDEIVIDDALNIVTTPACMLAQRISEAHSRISQMVATTPGPT